MNPANSMGSRFVVTTFGESHGKALGVIIDGCPSGIHFDEELLIQDLKRRRPGQHGSRSSVVSDREEPDTPHILSGVFEGKTLGTPIAIIVYNTDQRSQDYKQIAKAPRQGHADDTWEAKFGHRDYRGGGRSSGRETLTRVMAGAVAKMILKKMAPKTKLFAFASQIAHLKLDDAELKQVPSLNIEDFKTKMPSIKKDKELSELLLEAKKIGKSYGGVVSLHIVAPTKGLGQPVFHKLKSDLSAAFMSIGATSGVEVGGGFDLAKAEGSDLHSRKDQSHYGGIRGGISTGEKISFQIAIKPTATVLDHATKGRHDPCIIPRAIPVIEAMANIVLVDHLLWSLTDRA